jgi:hypothetical protein
MAITDPKLNPLATSTQETTQTAPDWYSNYLIGIAQSGPEAVQAGGVAGFGPLQQQAFAGAPAAITAGQPALDAATAAATGVATTSFMDNVGQYMNPYTQGVIEEMNRLGQKQFKETLAPGMTAGAVGSGQFGSTRGMQVYGNAARDVNKDILGAQAKYLAQGFDQATAMAKAEAELDIAASGRLGELSTRAYDQGVGGLDVLSKLGSQQQAQEQARLDYPMAAATKEAALLRGYNIPASTTQTTTAPMSSGYYQPSNLSQTFATMSGLGGLLANRIDPRTGQIISGSSPLATILSGVKGFDQSNLFKNIFSTSSTGDVTGAELQDYLNSMNDYLGTGTSFDDWLSNLTSEDYADIDWGV